MAAPSLEVRDIRKAYPGTIALDDVTLTFRPGQVHALLGRNGAGKSTLVKILSGAITPTSGAILVNGRDIALRSPQDALANGIATVYQELSIIPELTVAENMLLGRLPRHRGIARFAVDRRAAEVVADRTLDTLGVKLDVRRKAARLSVGQQQLVEIARAVSRGASAVLLDEPTSALARHEVAALFAAVRSLVEKNVAVVYITHRLNELREIADQVSVLRDGKLAGSVRIAEATPKTIVELMFGSSPSAPAPTVAPAQAQPVLQIRNLNIPHTLTDVSFTLHAGEILGIAGMLGSGRTELLSAIFGAIPFTSGEITIGNQTVRAPTPALMKRLGLAFTPESRKEQALVLPMSTRDNLCLAALNRVGKRGFVTRATQRPTVARRISELHIAAADPNRPVAFLSGGNQQKVVVGNWLNTEPRVILFDEPTRGIDVHAKQQIFDIIRDLSRRNIASIFVSSELEELPEICHRILILRAGRITAEVRPHEITLDQLVARCMES